MIFGESETAPPDSKGENSMIFTLEALQAKHGDCLILHYGPKQEPKVIVIDGGPGGVYRGSLRPRLRQVRQVLSPDSPLPLSMLMVSHMDDDHVNGVLDLIDDLQDAADDNRASEFDVEHMWFNTFDDIVGNSQIPVVSSLAHTATVADLTGAVPQFARLDHHLSAVVASTGQGRRLRDSATRLGITVNFPFEPLTENGAELVRGDVGDTAREWGDGLDLWVLHPNGERLTEMQEKWDKDLKKAAEKGDNSIIFASLASRDNSPFNLASIVCLAELGGKRILLTGDARDDDILDGLQRADLLDDEGRIHVDILKLPHHGSDRNMSRQFLERVTADHYVISGNGEHHNPDKAMLVMLSEATEGREDFTVHLTNHEGKDNLQTKLDEFITGERNHGRTYGFEYREEGALSLSIDLLDPIDY
jgi:beta-lactamase superfamily II metal-dependent hydrolase